MLFYIYCRLYLGYNCSDFAQKVTEQIANIAVGGTIELVREDPLPSGGRMNAVYFAIDYYSLAEM